MDDDELWARWTGLAGKGRHMTSVWTSESKGSCNMLYS